MESRTVIIHLTSIVLVNKLLNQFLFQRKEMKFPLMMFGWAVMSAACMKKNDMIVSMKKFQLKKMMFW